MTAPTYLERAKRYHQDLPPHIRQYLNQRHILDDIIEALLLGWMEFKGSNWITIPIFDALGDVKFFKLKRPPDAPDSQPKGLTLPSGSEATLYPLPYLAPDLKRVVLCEGEPDCLSLLSHGIEAVCGTHGCATFKDEWLDSFAQGMKVILAYDLDEPGQKAQQKVMDLFLEKRPDIVLAVADFGKVLSGFDGKDVTDFFTHPLLLATVSSPALPPLPHDR